MSHYELDDRGVRRLLAQAVIQALKDLDLQQQSASALAFFASDQLEWFADALGFTADRIRWRVAEGIDPEVLRLLRYANRAHKAEHGSVLAKWVQETGSSP
jgi:hypothetical protein